jgi:hypothetical protein
MRCLAQKTFSAVKVRVDQQHEMALCDLGGWVKTPRQGSSSLQPPSCWWPPLHTSITIIWSRSHLRTHCSLLPTSAERAACNLLLVLPSLVAHAAARSNNGPLHTTHAAQWLHPVLIARQNLPSSEVCGMRSQSFRSGCAVLDGCQLLPTSSLHTPQSCWGQIMRACFFSLQQVLDG